jgi:hypothetical protein
MQFMSKSQKMQRGRVFDDTSLIDNLYAVEFFLILDKYESSILQIHDGLL